MQYCLPWKCRASSIILIWATAFFGTSVTSQNLQFEPRAQNPRLQSNAEIDSILEPSEAPSLMGSNLRSLVETGAPTAVPDIHVHIAMVSTSHCLLEGDMLTIYVNMTNEEGFDNTKISELIDSEWGDLNDLAYQESTDVWPACYLLIGERFDALGQTLNCQYRGTVESGSMSNGYYNHSLSASMSRYVSYTNSDGDTVGEKVTHGDTLWQAVPACTSAPTLAPTAAPTLVPTLAPTLAPSLVPTLSGTHTGTHPDTNPDADFGTKPCATEAPTLEPTVAPTLAPTPYRTYEGALASARFANSGALLAIAFQGATDMGGSTGHLSGVFSCDYLFAHWAGEYNSSTSSAQLQTGGNDLDNAQECRWTSSRTVQMVLSSLNTVVPGDTLILKELQITRTVDGAFALEDSITIEAPDNPVQPNIVISAPSAVGACADLRVDASLSTGGGGRALSWGWALAASSSSPATAAAAEFLANATRAGAAGSALTLPSGVLAPGERYVLNLTARNFLGRRGWAAFSANVSALALPAVAVAGGARRTVYAYSETKLVASVEVDSCSNASTAISYLWKVYSENWEMLDIESTSSNPRNFELAAYSLEPSKSYYIVVKATDSNGNHNTAQVELSVARLPVAARVAGGSRTVPGGPRALLLDGSGSYDPNTAAGTLDEVHTRYQWSCSVPGDGNTSHPCGNFSYLSTENLISNSSQPMFLIPANSLFPDITFQFSLTVNTTWSVASTSVEITVASAAIPALDLDTSVIGDKVSPGDKLTLPAYLEQGLVSGETISYEWELVDDEGLTSRFSTAGELGDAALTGISGTLHGPRLASSPIYLVIAANELIAGGNYAFKISASYDGHSGAASAAAAVAVNGPPSSGAVAAAPAEGYALLDTFYLTALGWEDDAEDLPLRYRFYFVRAAANFYTAGFAGGDATQLRGPALSNEAAALLPLGRGRNGTAAVGVDVRDVHGAAGYASTGVRVRPRRLSASALAAAAEALLDAAREGYDGEGMLQVTASTSSLLSGTNCTLAPVCSALHREDCGDDGDHACGACQQGYTGARAGSSEACSLEGDSCSNGLWDASGGETAKDCGGSCSGCAKGKACLVDGDCESDNCVKGFCASPLLTCASDCSGHGTCNVYDLDGDQVDSCLTDDLGCTAVCACSAGWNGASCSMSDAQVAEKRALVEALVDRIEEASELLTLDEDTAEELHEVAFSTVGGADAALVSDAALANVLHFQHRLLEAMIDGGIGLTSPAAASLLGSYSLGLSAEHQANHSAFEALAAEGAADVQRLLLAGLAAGEAPSAVGSDRLKVAAARAGAGAGPRAVALAPSEAEAAAGRLAANISFGDNVIGDAHTSSISVKEIMELSDAQTVSRNLSVVGSSVTVNIKADNEVGEAQPISVMFALNSFSAVEDTPINTTITQAYCLQDLPKLYTIWCHGEEIGVECDGLSNYAFNVSCSTPGLALGCALLTSNGWDDSPCAVVARPSPERVVCNCTLPVLNGTTASHGGERRRLESGTEVEGAAAPSLVTIGSEVGATFGTATVLFLNPNLLGKSWAVFLTLGIFLVFIPTLAVLSPRLTASWHQRKRLRKLLKKVDYQRRAQALFAEDQAVLALRNAVGKPKNVGKRLWEGHDWLALFTLPTRRWTMGRKATILVADVITVMFWDATLFGLEYPQEQFCLKQALEDDCLVATTGGHPSCIWDEDQDGCVYFEPDPSFSEAIYMSMLSIMLTLPLLAFVGFVMTNMVMLPHRPICGSRGEIDDQEFQQKTELELDFQGSTPAPSGQEPAKRPSGATHSMPGDAKPPPFGDSFNFKQAESAPSTARRGSENPSAPSTARRGSEDTAPPPGAPPSLHDDTSGTTRRDSVLSVAAAAARRRRSGGAAARRDSSAGPPTGGRDGGAAGPRGRPLLGRSGGAAGAGAAGRRSSSSRRRMDGSGGGSGARPPPRRPKSAGPAAARRVSALAQRKAANEFMQQAMQRRDSSLPPQNANDPSRIKGGGIEDDKDKEHRRRKSHLHDFLAQRSVAKASRGAGANNISEQDLQAIAECRASQASIATSRASKRSSLGSYLKSHRHRRPQARGEGGVDDSSRASIRGGGARQGGRRSRSPSAASSATSHYRASSPGSGRPGSANPSSRQSASDTSSEGESDLDHTRHRIWQRPKNFTSLNLDLKSENAGDETVCPTESTLSGSDNSHMKLLQGTKKYNPEKTGRPEVINAPSGAAKTKVPAGGDSTRPQLLWGGNSTKKRPSKLLRIDTKRAEAEAGTGVGAEDSTGPLARERTQGGDGVGRPTAGSGKTAQRVLLSPKLAQYLEAKPLRSTRFGSGLSPLASGTARRARYTGRPFFGGPTPRAAGRSPHESFFGAAAHPAGAQKRWLSNLSKRTQEEEEGELKAEMDQLQHYLDQKVAQNAALRNISDMEKAVGPDGEVDWAQFEKELVDERQKHDLSGSNRMGVLEANLNLRNKLETLHISFQGSGALLELVTKEIERYKSTNRPPKHFMAKVWLILHGFVTKKDHHDRLIKDIQKHVMLAIYLEESLAALDLGDRNAALLGAAQMDYMTLTEHRILERIQQEEPEEDEYLDQDWLWPWWIPALGWLILIGYVVVAGLYIVLFGVRFGEKMVNMWLSTFFFCFAHDFVLFVPLQIWITYKVIPYFLSGHLDLSRVERLPAYSASLQVARRLPHLAASRVLLEHRLPPAGSPLRRFFSPGARPAARAVAAAAMAFLMLLVVLPYYIQDMVVEATINVIYSNIVLGLAMLHEHSKEGAGLVATFVLVLVVLFVGKKLMKRKMRKSLRKKKLSAQAPTEDPHEAKQMQIIKELQKRRSELLETKEEGSDGEGQTGMVNEGVSKRFSIDTSRRHSLQQLAADEALQQSTLSPSKNILYSSQSSSQVDASCSSDHSLSTKDIHLKRQSDGPETRARPPPVSSASQQRGAEIAGTQNSKKLARPMPPSRLNSAMKLRTSSAGVKERPHKQAIPMDDGSSMQFLEHLSTAISLPPATAARKVEDGVLPIPPRRGVASPLKRRSASAGPRQRPSPSDLPTQTMQHVLGKHELTLPLAQHQGLDLKSLNMLPPPRKGAITAPRQRPHPVHN